MDFLIEDLELWIEGLVHFGSSNYEKSIEKFNEINHKFSRITFNVAQANALMNNWSDTIRKLKEACRMDSYFAVGYFSLGYAFIKKSEYYKSFCCYKKCLNLLTNKKYIDYKQLGLQFQLYPCEVLSNLAVVSFLRDDVEMANSFQEKAENCKVQAKHQGIDYILNDLKAGRDVELFRVPAKEVFRPPRRTSNNLHRKDYLGSSEILYPRRSLSIIDESLMLNKKAQTLGMNERKYAERMLNGRMKQWLSKYIRLSTEASLKNENSVQFTVEDDETVPPTEEDPIYEDLSFLDDEEDDAMSVRSPKLTISGARRKSGIAMSPVLVTSKFTDNRSSQKGGRQVSIPDMSENDETALLKIIEDNSESEYVNLVELKEISEGDSRSKRSNLSEKSSLSSQTSRISSDDSSSMKIDTPSEFTNFKCMPASSEVCFTSMSLPRSDTAQKVQFQALVPSLRSDRSKSMSRMIDAHVTPSVLNSLPNSTSFKSDAKSAYEQRRVPSWKVGVEKSQSYRERSPTIDVRIVSWIRL